MLSRIKLSSLAAVATLGFLSGVIAAPTQALAQAGTEPVKVEKQQEGQSGRQGESRRDQRRDAGSSRETSTKSDVKIDRSRTTTRTTIRRDGDRDRSRITLRDRDRDRDRWRGRSSHAAVTFVILGPRHHYRPGWCRGLHRGKHYAPGQGWHAGRHVGLFRC
jgi:hypothetical protein